MGIWQTVQTQNAASDQSLLCKSFNHVSLGIAKSYKLISFKRILFHRNHNSHTYIQYSLGFERKHTAYLVHLLIHAIYEGESISSQPNLFPVEIHLFLFDVIAF